MVIQNPLSDRVKGVNFKKNLVLFQMLLVLYRAIFFDT